MQWKQVMADVHYAIRGLRRTPAFAGAVVATLGLGVGANTTMFGIVDQLLFRAPPFLHTSERVHRVHAAEMGERGGETRSATMSYPRFLELSVPAPALERAIAFADRKMAVGVGEDTREVDVEGVSGEFFALFKAQPAVGRFLLPAEDRAPDGTPVAVLSYQYWQTSRGGRMNVVGESITVGARQFTIVGVAPRGFRGMASTSPALFVPLTAMGAELFRDVGSSPSRVPPTYYGSHAIEWVTMIVRRAVNVDESALEQELSARFRNSYQDQRTADPRMVPVERARPRVIIAPVQPERGPDRTGESRVAAWLGGVAAIVLLIACFNVGNLLLARAFGRRREIAVRLAIGASKRQVLRQLFVESLVLATLGAACGLLIAQWGGQVLRSLLLPDAEFVPIVRDARLLLFAGATTLLVAVLTGMAPALHGRRERLADALRGGARGGSFHRSRLRTMLLVAQVALSVTLLIGAGLFVRSLLNVRSMDLGFDPERIAYVGIEMRGVTLEGEPRARLRRDLVTRAQAMPIVESATRTIAVPFRLNLNFAITVPGIDSAARLGDFYFNAGSPHYFRTMGTVILRGRGIEPTDVQGTMPVVVVSQSMASKLWPGEDAIGKCVKRGADSTPCSYVVGIAEDITRGSLSNDQGLQYYVPIEQMQTAGGGILVRTRGDARRTTEAVRQELQRIMPGMSYVTVTPLMEILGPVVRPWTLGATMFTAFGTLAVLLAGLGLYSVIAFGVSQRRQELALRLAIGAPRVHIVRLVVLEAARVVGAGLLIGITIALIASKFMEPFLFRVSSTDAVTFGTVITVLTAVALMAAALPAMQASRVDPNLALRAE